MNTCAFWSRQLEKCQEIIQNHPKSSWIMRSNDVYTSANEEKSFICHKIRFSFCSTVGVVKWNRVKSFLFTLSWLMSFQLTCDVSCVFLLFLILSILFRQTIYFPFGRFDFNFISSSHTFISFWNCSRRLTVLLCRLLASAPSVTSALINCIFR